MRWRKEGEGMKVGKQKKTVVTRSEIWVFKKLNPLFVVDNDEKDILF